MPADAMDEINGLVAVSWAHTPIVDDPNISGALPADGSAYLTIEYPLASEEMMTIGAPGANIFRDSGAARFVLSIPAGKGINDASAPWKTRLNELRAALRCKESNGVKTWEPSPVTFGGSSDDGAYYELTFALEFQLDVIG